MHRAGLPGTDTGRRLLARLPRERRMTRTHAVLWAAILASTVVDILLTMAGLELGLQEGNPVVRAMVSRFGLAGLWVVKYLAMLWLVAGWALLTDRNASIFLGLFASVTLAVTAHNAVLLQDIAVVVSPELSPLVVVSPELSVCRTVLARY